MEKLSRGFDYFAYVQYALVSGSVRGERITLMHVAINLSLREVRTRARALVKLRMVHAAGNVNTVFNVNTAASYSKYVTERLCIAPEDRRY